MATDGTAAAQSPASRSGRLADRVVERLAARGVRPNQISLLGLGFGVAAAIAVGASPGVSGRWHATLLLAAVAAMLLRLLCTVLDGVLAVRGNLRTPVGLLFNELPDRLSDLALFLAAGIAASGVIIGQQLGWLAAVAALLAEYVRTLGVACGAAYHFEGSLTKQRRVAVIVLACLAAAFAPPSLVSPDWLFAAALAVVAVGSVVTLVVRLNAVVAELSA